MGFRLFTLALLSFGWVANAETLQVASLSTNETVVVAFDSDGCFNQFARRYEIHGGKAKSFSAWQVEPPRGRPQSTTLDRSARKLGTVALSEAEARGLDALLMFYRQKKGGGCTTVNRIRIEYQRDGKPIGGEEFTDATCALDILDMALSNEDLRKQFGTQYDLVALKKVVSLTQIEGRMTKKMP